MRSTTSLRRCLTVAALAFLVGLSGAAVALSLPYPVGGDGSVFHANVMVYF